MNVADWFNVVVYTLIVVVTAPLAWMIWRLTKRYPDMRESFIIWCVFVGLAATVPVWILVTDGMGWYPGAVGGTVLLISIGHGLRRRRVILRALRENGDGRPVGRP